MNRILIKHLKGGEILAQAVYDQNGAQLLAAGTVYKNAYFEKLQNLKIDYLDIKKDNYTTQPYDESRKEFNPGTLRKQSYQLINNQLNRFEKVGSINIYQFEKFVFEIINELMESNHIIESLYMIQVYNHYTYEHSLHVTVIAIMICKKIDLPKYKIYEIAMGCMLHDLGKTKVPKEILNKPAKLTTEEFSEIKKHPENGYEYIKKNKHLSGTIQDIILKHHEKLDGSGYPLGLKREDICLGARICSVADVFDAMCSKRPYKEPIPLAESIRIMKSAMNKQLDMTVCTILESILSSTT